MGYTGSLSKKILDPGCGSGGFLVEILNRLKTKNFESKKLLTCLINNVVGFDVNPVAVLTARTNFILAIVSLLDEHKSSFSITIPIYLADSIITPTKEGKGTIENNSYQISTVEGIFSLPKDFVDSGQLNDGMNIIDHCLKNNYSDREFTTYFKQHIDISQQNQNEILNFYDKIQQLHKNNKNRIWIKIIQNSFAPLLHTEFDYVVGNPPWIKWDFLSKDYKKKLGHLYLDIYKLFSHKGMKAGLGYSHDDISIVFLYVAVDKYLKRNGKLGFVMKQTLYKSVAGNEFRKFKLEKDMTRSVPLKVLSVNDMLKLQPFKSSANAETSTIILKKGANTQYPVSYNVWIPNEPISENDTIGMVRRKITIKHKDAYPRDLKNLKDIWLIVDKGKLPIKIISGRNYYTPRHGIVNDLNAVFFVKILEKKNSLIRIQNNATHAKKKVKDVKKWIEKEFVYPFLKPRNIKKWHIDGYLYCLLPQKNIMSNNEREMKLKYPKTFDYFYDFKSDLSKRASRWFKSENISFYSIFGIGDYSFSSFKVVWSCMGFTPYFVVVSNVDDHMLGKKTIMPDNTIGSISFNNKKEANYVCALLNSTYIKNILESQSSKSKWGISIQMIKNIPIPKFDKSNTIHIELSNLSKVAHIQKHLRQRDSKTLDILSMKVLLQN